MNSFQIVESSILIVCSLLIAWLIVEVKKLKSKQSITPMPIEKNNNEHVGLKLQALERLTLFTERCSLKNLVDRNLGQGISAGELHQLLVNTIKSEYDYNITQQIYVNQDIWSSITRMKDQNIYVINHITANLAPTATGFDLSKLIVEYSATPNAEMSSIILDALQFEAKKILN